MSTNKGQLLSSVKRDYGVFETNLRMYDSGLGANRRLHIYHSDFKEPGYELTPTLSEKGLDTIAWLDSGRAKVESNGISWEFDSTARKFCDHDNRAAGKTTITILEPGRYWCLSIEGKDRDLVVSGNRYKFKTGKLVTIPPGHFAMTTSGSFALKGKILEDLSIVMAEDSTKILECKEDGIVVLAQILPQDELAENYDDRHAW